MTIPSIKGGKGSFNINTPKQILNTESSETIQIQTPVDDQTIENNIEPNNTTDNETINNAEPKEYSIQQFQKDYLDLVYYKVIPTLNEYESERKKRLAGAIIGAVILGLLGVYLFIAINGRGAGDAAALCIAGAFGLWKWLKKSFEKKIKKKVMPTLMQAIPGFYWQETPPVTKEDITEAKLFAFDKVCRKTFDDCFLGKYRGVEVLMSECNYEMNKGKQTYTVFNGVVIRIEMNKSFEGLTIVRPKGLEIDDCNDLKKAKLEEVVLEDQEFNKNFSTYSTDQIEARYLLTTAFMERLKNLTTAFASAGTFCSFHDKYIYLAPYCHGDLFNLCSLVKPITNSAQFDRLFEEFASILKFVDHFKLDKKLGL